VHSPSPAGPVAELVRFYDDNVRDYEAGGYKEARARNDLIDPLFKELGWDVRNEKRYAEAYREVILEASVEVEGRTKAPDYCFRIGQTPKFYVEAKKPAVLISDNSDAAYQLRRYAWSARFPLSVLTNFKEFSVYDCRVRPKSGDNASVARILYLTQDQYVERWNEIAELFSKEAILRGAFDRYAREATVKRGTEAVDEAFLDQLEIWRGELARVLALRNDDLNFKELNFAVQTILDRIIFLRICEESDIEPYGRLKTLLRVTDVYSRLVEFFRLADDRYNSGLFHFGEERGRRGLPDALTPHLQVDAKVLKTIIEGLYYPSSPYEFSVISGEILGEVYEQFLGKVIRLTAGHQAKVEEKPEVKEAGGIFYTPKFIVDAIIARTLLPHLEGKSPDDIADLRILDPACGSGSFLLGAYKFLLAWYRDYYLGQAPSRSKGKLVPGRGTSRTLSGEEKKRILLAHIFGVDKDEQAVEVTKLALLLEVLREESKENIDRIQKLFHERALPDLESNIKCGNSLIDRRTLQLRLSDEESQSRVNPFDYTDEFPAVFGRKDPGFDVVVGNPPYVRVQALNRWEPLEVELLKSRYSSAQTGNYDLYVVFVERGLELLRSSGTAGFILPHKFMHLEYGQPLRQALSNGRNVSAIVHFGSAQVFSKATTYTCLLFVAKAAQPRVRLELVHDLPAWTASGSAQKVELSWETLGASEWRTSTGPAAALMARLRQGDATLEDVSEKIFQGLATSADPIYVLRVVDQTGSTTRAYSKALGEEVELEPDLLRPLLKGSEVQRYARPKAALAVLFPYRVERGVALPIPITEIQERLPLSYEYLVRNKPELLSRSKTDKTNWWLYPYPKSLARYSRPKIISGVLSKRGSFTLDPSGDFCFLGGGTAGGNAIIVKGDNQRTLHTLLAILNSPVTSFFVANVGSAFRGGFFAFGKASLKGLPIPNFLEHGEESGQAIGTASREMLELHSRLDAASTPHESESLRRQIRDLNERITNLVFDLYDLSPQERETLSAWRVNPADQ
jgi:predicted type IV restriction endonuclease